MPKLDQETVIGLFASGDTGCTMILATGFAAGADTVATGVVLVVEITPPVDTGVPVETGLPVETGPPVETGV